MYLSPVVFCCGNPRFCKLFIAFILFSGILPLRLALSANPISVVSTLPVLKDLAEAIGNPHIRTSSLITGFESEHTYTPKPSDILSIQHADLLLKIGLGLETWVDPLIENADRPDLPIITTSKGVPLIDDTVSHADPHSDLHLKGNPHIWLDPENVKIMIGHITKALIAADPGHQDDYRKNASKYLEELSTLEKTLQKKVDQLQNKTIITHHPAWPYFSRRFGFIIKGTILTQIGSEPTAKQLGKLIKLIKKEGIKVVVSEPQLNQKIPQILAEETDVKIISLSPLTGAMPGTEHYVDLIRYNTEALVSALGEPR